MYSHQGLRLDTPRARHIEGFLIVGDDQTDDVVVVGARSSRTWGRTSPARATSVSSGRQAAIYVAVTNEMSAAIATDAT
jgi:hypothetical protein